MGVGKIFSRGGTRGFSQKFSRGGPKVVNFNFVFSHSKLTKQPFFAKHFKIQGGALIPLPTPMNAIRSTLNWSVHWNNHDETTCNLLCLVDYYHLTAQADIQVNNWPSSTVLPLINPKSRVGHNSSDATGLNCFNI